MKVQGEKGGGFSISRTEEMMGMGGALAILEFLML